MSEEKKLEDASEWVTVRKKCLIELLETLEEITIQADQDCPEEHRSRHFKEALKDAIEVLQNANNNLWGTL